MNINSPRALILMAAAAKVLREAEPDVAIEYDGTTCDAACLADDLESEVEDSLAGEDVRAEFRLEHDYDGSRACDPANFQWADTGIRVAGDTLPEALRFVREYVRKQFKSRFCRGYRLVRRFSTSGSKVVEVLTEEPAE